MAGSRLEKYGTVFTRVRDLMRSGVIPPAQKPLWYDVFEAFPPKRDPVYVKPVNGVKKRSTVPNIFYREDELRAKFYVQYRVGKIFELYKPSFVSTCQRFVDKYGELQRQGTLEESALFEETGKALLSDGIVLQRKRHRLVSAESRAPVPELEEQAEDLAAGSDETMDDTTQTLTEPTDPSNSNTVG